MIIASDFLASDVLASDDVSFDYGSCTLEQIV